MSIELFTTGDGSLTLRDCVLDETFHSQHGARSESEHVFIRASGLPELLQTKTPITVLEVGFGTGLNLLLTALALRETPSPPPVTYLGLENRLLPSETLRTVHSALDIRFMPLLDELCEFVDSADSQTGGIGRVGGIACELRLGDATTVALPPAQAQVVFQDAFSPAKCPALWTPSFLKCLADAMAPEGVLVTYCAQGQFRRDLAGCGLTVERLPGPPGKTHMTRATKAARPVSD